VEWVVHAKRPFAGPEAVLAYLSRYTHRVAISNSRLIALDERGAYRGFKWKGKSGCLTNESSGSQRRSTATLG